MKSIFRGIFLTSSHPERTASFYRDVAGLEIETVGDPDQYVYWKVDDHGVQLAIHDAKAFADYTYPAVRESNLTHLYFQIDSLEVFSDHLETLGIPTYVRDDVVITVVDPDGRKVMFGIA